MNRPGARLLHSGGIKAATTGVVAVLGLASSAVLARTLDQTALGVFALLLAMVQIGTMFADGGSSMATTRFIAAARGTDAQRQAVRAGLKARLLTTAGIVVLGAALTVWLLDVLFHHAISATAYLWALAWIVTKSLFLFAPAVARGRMNWTLEGLLLVMEALAIMVVYASLRWWPGGADALPLRLAAAYLVMLLPAQICLRWRHGPAGMSAVDEPPAGEAASVRRLMAFGLPLVLNASFFLLLTWTDRIMIGVMSSPEDLAVYYIAANLAGAGRMLFSIPEQVLYSHLAAHTRAGDPALTDIHARLFRLFASLGSLFVVLAGAAGVFAIPLLYGDTYQVSVWPFQLLLIVLLVRVISIPASLLLIVVYERTAETRDALGLAFIVNILVNVALIPRLGLTGAIVGSLVAFAVATGYLWWSLWKIAGLRAAIVDQAAFVLPAAAWLAVAMGVHFGSVAPWLAWIAYALLAIWLGIAAMRQLKLIGLLGRTEAVAS